MAQPNSHSGANAPIQMLSSLKKPWQPKSFKFWYDSIIDWMLANPGGSLVDCGRELNRHPVTLRMIVGSDMFKARYAERRGAINDDYRDAILLKSAQVASSALSELHDRLVHKPQSIPAATLADIASSSMEALGFGARSAGQAVPTQEVHVHVGADVLSAARDRMRTIEGQKLAEVDESRMVAQQPASGLSSRSDEE